MLCVLVLLDVVDLKLLGSCGLLPFALMVTTDPVPRLSSMLMVPWVKSRYSFTMGRPDPTPRM